MFSEKLSYIMMITNTSNTELAKALNVNQSLISKFKKGARIPPQNSNYIKKICDFFYNKISKSKESDEVSSKLSFEGDLKTELSKYFVNNSSLTHSLEANAESSVALYYEDEGKRDATIELLKNIMKYDKNLLYIYSDENMTWMSSLNSSDEWNIYLSKVINSGIKIKIIHSLNRNFIELFTAVSIWFPLYLSGNIEPYYIPKLRDGINRRSLFVSNHDAVISNSVNEKTNKMLNIYIKDKKAIKALKEEFNNYLALATPLFKKITFNEKKYTNYNKYTKKVKGNIKTTIYILHDKELVVSLPNSNYALKTTEPIMIRAFTEYLIKK